MKNLQLALRSLLHFKQYTIINILGLILALSCFVMISRYVYSEMTVDRFNQNLDRMFVSITERADNPGIWQFDGIQPHDALELQNHPGVERHSSYFRMTDDVTVDNRTYSANILIADEHFMEITCYPVIVGSNLTNPGEVLISAAFAERVFGRENPVGRVITYSYILQRDLTIVGVIGEPSTKSSLSFDFLISMDIIPGRNWGRQQTLFLLYPNVNFEDINRQFSEPIILRAREARVQLFPYRDIYFNTRVEGQRHQAGNHTHVVILSLVGVLILLIGVINYINIYTVVILRRSKEFGMKKVFGAPSAKIFTQLFTENFLLVSVSLVLAFGVAQQTTSAIQNLLGMEQVLNTAFDVWLSVSLVFVLSILTSIAPFIHYNYAAPIKSLRSVALSGKSLASRKTFLVLQYVATLVMITVSLFFVKQLHSMLNVDLGFRTENIIRVSFERTLGFFTPDIDFNVLWERQNQRLENLEHKINASPLITTWTWGRTPNEIAARPVEEFRVPDGELQPTTVIQADEYWLELFDIELIAGRGFDREQDIWSYNLIVSESALRQFGISNFADGLLVPPYPLQMLQNIPGNENNPPFRIVGVVRDFYPAHLSQHQYPIVFIYSPFRAHTVLASFHPDNRQEAIEFMRNAHDELIGVGFSFRFIDDEMAAIYEDDRRVAIICAVFTFIAIFISALGLFALSLFDIKQRRKEIALRKVNGAMTKDIIALLLKKYAILLGISFLVSIPISLFAIHRYLEGFAHRASISWWLFAVSLIITVAVSLLTLIYQTYKASNENPADVVKSE